LSLCADCGGELPPHTSHCGTCRWGYSFSWVKSRGYTFSWVEGPDPAPAKPLTDALLRLIDSTDDRVALDAARALIERGYIE
jgi:hypothetical protein